MSEIDTRLRETLQSVSDRTLATSGAAEFVGRRRARTGAWAAVAAFAMVVLVIGTPLFLMGDGAPQPGAAQPPVEEDDQWTVDPEWFVMSQADVEWMEELGRRQSPDGRFELRTEEILCAFSATNAHLFSAADSVPGSEVSLVFPLEADMTEAEIVNSCIEWGHTMLTSRDGSIEEVWAGGVPSEFTVCRGVNLPHVYEEMLVRDAEVGLRIEGSFTDLPGRPAVFPRKTDCVSERIGRAPELAGGFSDDLDLDVINHARRVEIALWRASHENCFSYEQAMAVAEGARSALGPKWLLMELPVLSQDGPCFQPGLDLGAGWVSVAGRTYPYDPVTTGEFGFPEESGR